MSWSLKTLAQADNVNTIVEEKIIHAFSGLVEKCGK